MTVKFDPDRLYFIELCYYICPMCHPNSKRKICRVFNQIRGLSEYEIAKKLVEMDVLTKSGSCKHYIDYLSKAS